jgi:AraC-like DNA-binding protein
MAEGNTLIFGDPDGYAAEFGAARVNLTISGAGDFRARLTRLKLKHLEVYRCYESLPRIAYVSLPPEPIFLSFPMGRVAPIFEGFVLRNTDIVLHSRGERMHQRSSGECQWGLISLSPVHLANCSAAMIGRPIASPSASRIIRPSRVESLRLRRLFRQACHLAEAGRKLIERPEVARALEQEMLHAIIHCLAGNEADDGPKTRHHHTVVMGRFEESLSKHIDQNLSMPKLCAEIDVAERTLRMCCAKFLGVSPTRYRLLRRLNQARSALRRANSSMATVAEIARNHQFLELGRFAVTYRAIFGESPSVTLERDL